MQDKEKLSMYVDIIKITIIICWVSLVAFWLLKIFGGNLFEIMVENENFLKFSELVQNSWLKYLVSFITIGVAKYFTFVIISQKFTFTKKDWLYFFLFLISIWFVSNFVPIGKIYFPSWYGYLLYIAIGILYNKGWKKTFGIIAIGLEFAFATISMLVRNIPLELISNYLVGLVLSIDVYIMLALYYLYSILLRKEKEL